MLAHVSPEVARALAQNTRHSLPIVKGLVLKPTSFFSHSGPVDTARPLWTEHELLLQHRDSYGVRPSEHPRGHLRICSLDVRAAGLPPWERFTGLREELESKRPNVMALFGCDEDWRQRFERNPRFQHLYAIAGFDDWPRRGPLLVLGKQLIGDGTQVRWTRFREPHGQEKETGGMLVADVASRGMINLRIAALDLPPSATARASIEQAGEILTNLNEERRAPIIVMHNSRTPLSGADDTSALGQAERFIWRGSETSDFEVQKGSPIGLASAKWLKEGTPDPARAALESAGLVADVHLVYKQDSRQHELYERFEKARVEYEERHRNIPASMGHSAAAIQKVLDGVEPVKKEGEAFSRRRGGRPVPRRER